MATENDRKIATERGQWLDQLARDPDMTAAAYSAALMIMHYHNRIKGRAWASLDRMAQDFGKDRSGINRGILKLEELKHIEVLRHHGRAGSDYFLKLSEDVIASKPAAWKTRHRPRNVPQSSDIPDSANVPQSSDIAKGQNVGRFGSGMSDGSANNVPQSSALTLEEPGSRTLEEGQGPQAPDPSSSGCVESFNSPSADHRRALPPNSNSSADPGGSARKSNVAAKSLFPNPEMKAEFEDFYRRREWEESFTDAASRYITVRETVGQEVIFECLDDPGMSELTHVEGFLSLVTWRTSDDGEDCDFLSSAM